MPEMPLDNFSRVLLKKREVFDSEIGYFTNTYTPKIKKGSFVQDSISFIRKKATVKGLHFQKAPFAQAKIQAQEEVLAIFGYSRSGVAESELLDITQSGVGNAKLLAISAILQNFVIC